MIYPYYCEHCEVEFDVTKSMHDSGRVEHCYHCGKEARRVYTASHHILGTAVQHAEYNPGLGQVVKNKRHREELCKRKNLIEVGNDLSAEKMHKHYDSVREEKIRKSWEQD